MTNDEGVFVTKSLRGVCVKRPTVHHSALAAASAATSAFTLIELIVVTAVIIILTGLVLSTVGYVRKKGARARAETEIAAMSAACESYKADNGIYPTGYDDTIQHYRHLADARQ